MTENAILHRTTHGCTHEGPGEEAKGQHTCLIPTSNAPKVKGTGVYISAHHN